MIGGDDRTTDHSVVVDGKLNPAIFQPVWLASVGVIEPAEAQDAASPLISPEVSLVRTPRLSLQVTHDRLLIRGRGTAAESQLVASEVTIRLLRQLPHTPVSSFDMIHEVHLPPASAAWTTLASRLVMPDGVTALLPNSLLEEFTLDRREDDGARVTLVLEPSRKLKDGTYLRVHREYALDDEAAEGVGTASWAAEMLGTSWEASVSFAEATAAAVQSYAT